MPCDFYRVVDNDGVAYWYYSYCDDEYLHHGRYEEKESYDDDLIKKIEERRKKFFEEESIFSVEDLTFPNSRIIKLRKFSKFDPDTLTVEMENKLPDFTKVVTETIEEISSPSIFDNKKFLLNDEYVVPTSIYSVYTIDFKSINMNPWNMVEFEVHEDYFARVDDKLYLCDVDHDYNKAKIFRKEESEDSRDYYVKKYMTDWCEDDNVFGVCPMNIFMRDIELL